MLHNVASSFTSVFFCTSLGDPNCVDCWVSSLGEPIGFSTIVWAIVTSTPSTGLSTWYDMAELNKELNPLHGLLGERIC